MTELSYRQLLAAATRSFTYSVSVGDQSRVSIDQAERCAGVTGYLPKDYDADPILWLNTIHPDDRERVCRHAQKIFKREHLPPIDYRILHRDGTTRWVRDTIIRYHDCTGRLIRYDGLVEEITERKQAETQRRYQSDLAEMLIETMPAMMFMLDTEGHILRCSWHAEEATGCALHDVIGQDCFTTFVPESHRQSMRALLNEVCEGHAAVGGVHPMVTKKGTVRDIEWAGKAARDDQGNILYVVLTGHDVTELRGAQQSLA
jgi:sigma-B regulation protein RsbU (phosphoserine phosphatase)